MKLKQHKAKLRLYKIELKSEQVQEKQILLQNQIKDIDKQIIEDTLIKQDLVKKNQKCTLDEKEVKNQFNNTLPVNKVKKESLSVKNEN